MPVSLRSVRLLALAAAATIAAAASSANAAFSYVIAADNSSQTTISPTFVSTTTNPGPLFTVNGAPNVTGNINFDFSPGLSANFKAVADAITSIQQETDGHLVINLHFTTPTSISAQIVESGIFSTTGGGSVAVNGGEVAIEAVTPLPTETHSAALTPVFGAGTWSATASTAQFSGAFTDYQISIDNDLVATALTGSASIQKTSFTLIITPEPTSLSLLAIGAGSLLMRRRRRA